MDNKIRVLRLDPEKDNAEVLTIDRSLEGYYEAINCRIVEMPVRYIGNEAFTVICDEEGTFKDNIFPSAFDSNGQAQLVGTLLFCRHDFNQGILLSLSDEDIALLQSNVRKVCTTKYPEGVLAMMGVENWPAEMNFMGH